MTNIFVVFESEDFFFLRLSKEIFRARVQINEQDGYKVGDKGKRVTRYVTYGCSLHSALRMDAL